VRELVDVLSQNEIDALLAALSSGEMDAEDLKKEEVQRKVSVYDFKRAVRFSKDHIRSLTRIHENFARFLTTYFSAQLRTFVQINVVDVEQLPYDEFIRSIPKMTILNIFEAEPLEGRMVLEVHPNVAYAMLDRMLGGQGTAPSKINNLTEIETTVMERVFARTFESLQEAWKTVIDISGMINLCIPHVVLEPIMPRLSVHHWFVSQKKERAPEEVEILEQRLHKAKLPIVAELGETSITIHEFLTLNIGDVLTLNKPVDEGLNIKVGDKLKFIGSPGSIRDKLAVQVDEIVSEGAEKDYDE
jgi:flagellar motor switch protein FliM